MKKIISVLIFTMLFAVAGVASANLDDTRATIAQRYGDYRLVIDTDNQLWTKADWEGKGQKKAKAAAYTYSFTRNGVHFSMEVMYEGDKPDAAVRIQRIAPDMPIKLKEVRQYFPEIVPLIENPKAVSFATFRMLSRQFQELESPVRYGVLVRELQKDSFFTLMAFNIQNEGLLVKQLDEITPDTYVREFTIEKTFRTIVHDKLDVSNPDWSKTKNYL